MLIESGCAVGRGRASKADLMLEQAPEVYTSTPFFLSTFERGKKLQVLPKMVTS